MRSTEEIRYPSLRLMAEKTKCVVFCLSVLYKMYNVSLAMGNKYSSSYSCSVQFLVPLNLTQLTMSFRQGSQPECTGNAITIILCL